jgi:hypothetical protein
MRLKAVQVALQRDGTEERKAVSKAPIIICSDADRIR